MDLAEQPPKPQEVVKPSASISHLIFSDGTTLKFQPTEKIIIVGANNSGKSQSLRDIAALANADEKAKGQVVTTLTLTKAGDFEALQKFLKSEAQFVDRHYRYGSWSLYENQLGYWNSPNLQGQMLKGFLKSVAATERLVICDQQPSISPGEQKSRPQHVLYDDSALMAKISQLFRRAFNVDLMFDFRGGSKLPIHVGAVPTGGGMTDRVSDAYVAAVRANPPLDKQGDGMKSYAGILFEAVVASVDMTLIDEPEAFLHPPQMRKLGETLAAEMKGQLFVATHSSDILRGFLEGTQGNVRILRLQRDGAINHVTEAASDVIKELWEKPELRYSNGLEGLFHEQTIICENDSDCRLLNSVADNISLSAGGAWKDTAYVPTGGKHGVAKVAGVLRKVGVPVKAIFDIDFLAEEPTVQIVVEAFGGNWAEIKPILGRVDAAVRDGIKPKTIPEIKTEIISMLNKSEPDKLPKGDVTEAMKQTSAWSYVKKFGEVGIPNGQAQKDYKHLKERMEAIGIYWVPVGEVENFCREIGLHGPKFVTSLLSTVPLDDDRLADLRTFVKHVHLGADKKEESGVDAAK